jgi:hypothetical protein
MSDRFSMEKSESQESPISRDKKVVKTHCPQIHLRIVGANIIAIVHDCTDPHRIIPSLSRPTSDALELWISRNARGKGSGFSRESLHQQEGFIFPDS